MKSKISALILTIMLICGTRAQAQESFNGLQTNMTNLYRLSDAETRSISPENFTGEKGKGGMAKLKEGSAAHAAQDLGQGWKVNPYIIIEPGETFTLGEIDDPGVIQHIWMTATGTWRNSILRMYWDGEDEPSVEVPVGDFFAQGWGEYEHINSMPIVVNPGSGFNSYWQMPFRDNAKITMTNRSSSQMKLYYQIDYALNEIPEDAAYFHAQFQTINPLPYKDIYTIVDNIEGEGHYVGTYLAHGANSPGWWGEGEVKFYMDGDTKFPTINGTGEEDYFLGSYGYGGQDFTTNYAGYHQIKKNNSNIKQRRFGQYRWHIPDPIRFEEDLRVTVQSLGWQAGRRYLPLQDHLFSVAYWYQTEPHNPFPELPSKEELAISWEAPLNHLGKISDLELKHQPEAPYAPSPKTLLNAETAPPKADNSKWVGFKGDDMIAVIDMKRKGAVQEVSARFLRDQGNNIFHPSSVEISVSNDGENFETVYHGTNETLEQPFKHIKTFETPLKDRVTRYVKVVAKNIGDVPSWHTNAGSPAWILADEIIVR